jgi:hypothetical protein
MRSPWILVAVAVIAAIGCVQTNNGNGGDGGGGEGGAKVCEKGNCEDCLVCADNGPCKELNSACYQDAACNGIAGCVVGCGPDLGCEQECYQNNPAGVSLYTRWVSCGFCEECPADCAGRKDCGG